MPDLPTWSRRAVLVGAAGVLTACASDETPTAPPSSTSPPTTSTSAGSATATTTTPPPTPAQPTWAQLEKHVSGTLLRPQDADYDEARLLQNPRFDDLRPAAVLKVADADDVATAFRFAQDTGRPVALRSGGHCYAGWSAGDEQTLVLDCCDLSRVQMSGDGTATIGPGALLLDVYRAIGAKGRAIAAGSCPTVGFGGLALGGGVGVLTRAMGLTCDAVTSMQVVLADGSVVTASADEEPDLYWALRGGGGGHVGLVTEFTVDTQTAPDLSTAYLQWSIDAASDVLAAWQDWAPDADARLWSTIKGLGGATHTDGAILLVSATWTGPDSAFESQLAGLLDHVPTPDVDVPHRRTYLEAMESFAGTPTRESFGATSHVAYDPLDRGGVSDLVEQVQAAQDSALKEAGISIDALGGRVADLAPGDTAFVHRQALATVQYTATFPSGTARQADAFVHGFRDAMTPHWGDSAYVNYADPTLADPNAAYFGDNAARLADVRTQYDPDGFFTQPQDW